MEATIKSNQMDVETEEARPGPDLASLPQERHVWRMPEFPPIPQGLNHFQVEAIEMYQSQSKNWFREAKEEEWEICPSLWQGAMNSYLKIKSFQDQKKELKMTPALEKEDPVAPSVQRQAQRTSEEEERSQEPLRKGKRQSQLAQTLPTGVQDPQI
ncbi:hypothetical protein O181_023151 [Austropuccinia psidii MF-1]|uniref:Uncharacterized protein n=1 Tax=Austropuccinia psidii MF-1 TaxID=1389203 RepID=A0A9Q3CE96_9BASI|nr:hypothetical protein [Austropuccinia psidii MF-1]